MVFLGIVLLAACHKDPPKTYDDTDITITFYNTDFDFSSYDSFIIPDSTVLKTNYFTGHQITEFYKAGGTSDLTLGLARQTFSGLGYTEAASLEEADFIAVPTVIHIEDEETVIYNPGWWWGYPGYGWGISIGFKGTQYYYYPVYPWYPTGYPVSVSTYTGALVFEVLDAESYRKVLEWEAAHPDPPGPDDNPPVYEIHWQAIVEGHTTDDGAYDNERAINGMQEAIDQSPYLRK